MPGVYLLWAEAPPIASAASPGQFLMVRTSDDYQRPLRRPLSVHRVADGSLALLYEVIGGGTQWLAQRAAGQTVDLLGPLGHGFQLKAQNVLLVAGGCGIAPLVFLAERALAQGHRPVLLLGACSGERIYPRHLLPQGVQTMIATDDGSLGQRGAATDFMEAGMAALSLPAADVPDQDTQGQVCACGPLDMYRAMAAQKSLNGGSVQVSLEARMGCGYGVCYGCTIETRQGLKQVCKDGPVFELSELML